MKDKKLSKRECAYIAPAVSYGWRIEISAYLKTARWNGDSQLPVRVGRMAESLIERGYLERITGWFGRATIRATERAEALRCNRCDSGYVRQGRGSKRSPCPHCTMGVKPE